MTEYKSGTTLGVVYRAVRKGNADWQEEVVERLERILSPKPSRFAKWEGLEVWTMTHKQAARCYARMRRKLEAVLATDESIINFENDHIEGRASDYMAFDDNLKEDIKQAIVRCRDMAAQHEKQAGRGVAAGWENRKK